MTRAEFKHIIAFCILMQNGQGIRSKHPSYVMSKFRHAQDYSLDDNNQLLYNRYMTNYGISEMHFEDE